MTSQTRAIFLVSHSNPGGAQEIWADAAKGFIARGHSAQLMALYPGDGDQGEMKVAMPWSYILPEKPRGATGTLALLRALIAFFRREAPDVVFTALPAANALAPLAAALAGAKTRVVVSHHSPADTYSPALNWLGGLTGSLKHARAVVAVSNTVSRTLDNQPAVYRAKRQTIHNALPPHIEDQLERLVQPRTAARSRKVVASGRLAPEKNYPVLLRAAVRLPDVEFLIIGNGPEEAALKAEALALGVADRVHFLGRKPRAEALEILAAADIFAQPSFFEGHSLALIEAAKVSLPLLVSSAPGQVEGITRADGVPCGIVIEPHDDEGLAREIARLLDDAGHYALWAERSRTIGEAATFTRMIDAYEALVA